MSGFTEKLKDAIQGRSKHRHSRSPGKFSNGRRSTDYGARKSTEVSRPDRGSPRTSKSITPAAMEGSGIHDQDGAPAPPPSLPTDTTQRIQEARPGSSASPEMNGESPVAGDLIPPRHSSMPRKPVGGRRSPKSPARPNDAEADRMVGHKTTRSADRAPNDHSPLALRTTNNTFGKGDPASMLAEGAARSPTSKSTYTSHHESIHRPTSSSQTAAPASFSQPTLGGGARSSIPPPLASQTADTPAAAYPPRTSSRRGTLPSPTTPSNSVSPSSVSPPFSSKNALTTPSPPSTTQTHVDTIFAPAATAEIRHTHTTSVIRPVITRDIHIDHYYHYTQPVQLPPSILPAKHYHLDLATNIKTEIPAPEGWVLPAHLQPTEPADVDWLGKFEVMERHYVVDERSPGGRLERAEDRVGLGDADHKYGYGQESEQEVWSDAVATA